jgi:hypothetical protein
MEELPIYEDAMKDYLKLSGDDRLYIEKNAYCRSGKLLHNYYSLHTKYRGKDLSDFWRIIKQNEIMKRRNDVIDDILN